MKIIKPKALSLLHKPFQFEDGFFLTVCGMSFFSLTEQGKILSEIDKCAELYECLGDTVLDMCLPKARSEFLVLGSAYAPAGKAITHRRVLAQLGAREKQLEVRGEQGADLSGEKFTRMSLGYERAYGGKDHPFNPLGRGYHPGEADNNTDYPNLFYPGDEPCSGIQDQSRPASLGPVALDSADKIALAGRYDQHWLDRDFPGLPRDIDWQYCNRAAPDQQFSSALKGSEAFRLVGMHPEREELAGTLPGILIRTFIKRQHRHEIEEVDSPLDTCWFVPDREFGVLLSRARVPVEDSEAEDIDAIMLAFEHVQDSPKSLQHYQRHFQWRTEPETALAQAFNDRPLSPQESEQALAERRRRRAAHHAREKAKTQTLMSALNETLQATLGESAGPVNVSSADDEAFFAPSEQLTPEELDSGNFDLSPYFAAVDRELKKAKARVGGLQSKGKQLMQQADEARAEKSKAPASDASPRQTQPVWEPTTVGEKKYTASALPLSLQRHCDSLQKAVEGRATQMGVEDKNPEQEQQTPISEEEKVERAATRVLEGTRQLARRFAVKAEPISRSDTENSRIRECVSQLLGRGEDLAGMDLSGADLSGLNFSGACLDGALLENTSLSDCLFHNTSLRGAVLTGARLDRADFSDADLDEANLSSVSGEGVLFDRSRWSNNQCIDSQLTKAHFNQAVLKQVSFIQGQFSDCDFSNSQFLNCSFAKCVLGGACFANSRWLKVNWVECDLRESDFRQGSFSGVSLSHCQCDDSDFSGAQLENYHLVSSTTCTGCDFSKVRAQRTGWRGIDLSHSRWCAATFSKSDFGSATFDHGDFSEACFYQCLLSKASCHAVHGKYMDGLQSIFRKANFSKACLDHANWWGADIFGTDFSHSSRQAAAIAVQRHGERPRQGAQGL